MNLKYLLKKTINIKTSYLITIIILVSLVITGCFSYAIFTVRNESKGSLNIVTGNLFSLIESIDLDQNKSITLNPNEIKTIKLKLINVNSIDAKLNLYYATTSNNISIGYLVTGDEAPSTSGYVLGKNGSVNDNKIINVQIKNNDGIPATVTFGTNVGLSTSPLAFPNDKTSIIKIANNYITKAYTYDETNELTKCITGEETTCVETDCFNDTENNSCPMGTIIKYKVNDNEEKYFYVLHDDGKTMTLQQRENTIRNVAWYGETNNNTKGPLTILSQLENVTSGWNNVESQTYKMGTTSFGNTNVFTGCSAYNNCTINKYTLPERTTKARMITNQEMALTGCTNINGSCPDWMHNYLFQSTLSGGSVDDNSQVTEINNNGYWTMSAFSSESTSAWALFHDGSLKDYNTSSTDNGARAVIEISK